MADAKTTLDVLVNEKGAKAATKNLKELGAAIKDTEAANKGLGGAVDNTYSKQEKGIIGTANSTKSFSKLAQTITGGNGLVPAYATLAANVFAVTAAFNALSKAAQTEQVFRGLEASGARVGTNLTSAAKALQEVTNNAISAEQSMRSVAVISSAGFGTEEIIKFGQAARDTSFALGRNMTDSMERLTKGIIKLEPELLDELGIMTKLTQSNAAYATSLGKTESQLTNFEKRQGFLNAVLEEATVKFGGLSNAAGDSVAYDQLSAAFTDLSTQVLGFTASALTPLVQLLAGSGASLTGASLLFFSTIKSKLAPGLTEAAVNTRALALATSEEAKARLDSTNKQMAALRTQKELEVSQVRVTAALEKSPKVYKELEHLFISGEAGAKDYARGIRSLSQSIEYNENVLKGMTDPTQIANTKAQIQILTDRKTELEKIKNPTEQLAKMEEDIAERKKKAAKEINSLQRRASAENKAAQAIERAGALNLIGSYKALTASVREYHISLQLANTGGVTGFTALRTAAFAATTAFKAAASAILTIIPYIGLISLAVGALKSAWEALKSEETKKREEAFKNLADEIVAAGKAATELAKIQKANASESLKTSQSITLQGNAIDGLITKYREAIATQTTLNKVSEDSGNKIASVWQTIANPEAFKSWHTQVSQNSEALRVLGDAYTGVDKKANISNKALTNSVQTLDRMYQLAPEATREVVNLHGGLDRISKLSTDKKIKAIDAVLADLQNRTGPAAQQIKELTENMQSAELAFSEFMISAAPSTSFDKTYNSLSALNKSIENIAVSVARGSKVSEDFDKVLTGLGPKLRNQLSVDSNKFLEGFEKASAEVNTLVNLQEDLAKQGKVLEQHQQARLDAQTKLKASYQQQLPLVTKDLQMAEDREALARRDLILKKSELTLLQTSIQVNEKNYSITAQGVAARITAENKVKDLQAASLVSQKAALEAGIAIQKNKLITLETEGLITEELKKQTEEQLRREIATAREAKDAAKRAALEKGFNVEAMSSDWLNSLAGRANLEGRGLLSIAQSYVSASEALAKADERYNSLEKYKSINKEIESLGLAVQSLQNEIGAILDSKLTEAEKWAAINEKQVEIDNQRLTTLQNQRNTISDIIAEQRKNTALLLGNTDTLKYQLDVLKESAAIERSRVETTYAQQRASIQARIETNRAAKARANSEEEKKANAANLEYLNTEQELLERSQQAELKLIDIKSKNAILEKIIFDTRKEGLDWQQDALSNLNKQLDAQRNLTEESQNYLKAYKTLQAAQRGHQLSQEGEEALEIRAATAAYKLALQEVDIKKKLIDLEFALLDAQKEVLQGQLAERKAALTQMNTSGQFDAQISQLDATMKTLFVTNFREAADLQKRALDIGLATQRANLEYLTKEGLASADSITAKMQGLADKYNAQREARDTLATAQTAKGPFNDLVVSTEKMSDSVVKSIQDDATAAISEQTQILANVDKNIANIDANLAKSVNIEQTSSINASGNAKIAMDYFTKNGFTLAQAAGIVGNLQQESGVNLNTRADNGQGHVGIAQWNRDRQAEFLKVMGKAVKDASLEDQLRFIVRELNTGWTKRAGDDLRRQTTVEGAARSFNRKYEISGETGAAEQKRVNYAKNLVSIIDRAVVSASKAVETVKQEVESQEIIVEAKIKPEIVNFADELDLTALHKALREGIQEQPLFSDQAKDKSIENLYQFQEVFGSIMSTVTAEMAAVGVDSPIVNAMVGGFTKIAQASSNAFNTIKAGADIYDTVTAAASVLTASVSTVQGILDASSKARIANIDREIAAEQARDGKSAESQAKIAALEKKKDQIAKKQFETNKKLQMAQAVISTASGVAQALSWGGPAGIALAAMVGAMGAAQIAIISGTSYQSAASTVNTADQASTLSIGKRGDSVDLARNNTNLGGELGYLRGNQGYGSNSSNYQVVGSAYGGSLPRGYGNTSFLVGEKGPEIISPEAPVTVSPVNDNQASSVQANINIRALDASGVEEILKGQRGNIISMLREAANASGQSFLEDVDVNVYTRPNIGRL